MMSVVHDLMDRYHGSTYVVLTFAISWSFFGSLYVLPGLAGIGRAVAVIGGAYGPMIAAMVLLAVRGESVWSWLTGIFSVRVTPSLWVIALGLPVLGVTMAGLTHVFAFGGILTLSALPSFYEFPLFLLFVLVLGGGQEEPGWRGYLLPLLQARYSALVSAVAIGGVWALWHLPLFGVPGTVQSEISFVVYAPYVIALSVILTWVANRSAGSVLPVMVFHAAVNAMLNYYPAGGEVGITSGTAQVLLAVTTVIIAVGIVALSGDDLGLESETASVESGIGSPK